MLLAAVVAALAAPLGRALAIEPLVALRHE